MRLAQDAPRLLLAPEYPQHFAQMRRNLGIGSFCIGSFEDSQSARHITLPVEYPAEAIENETILRRQLECLFNQLARFRQAKIAFGEGISQGVVGLSALRAQFDELAQAAFEQVHASEFFSK